MEFKKIRGLYDMPYMDQLYIWAYCRVAGKLRGEADMRVQDVCIKVGGEDHCDDIYQVIALGKPVRRVAIERYLDERTLYTLRAKAYRELHRRLFAR